MPFHPTFDDLLSDTSSSLFSYSSDAVYDILVQDTEIVSSKFIYNYFIANERISEDIMLGEPELRTKSRFKAILKNIDLNMHPRYNEIKIKNMAPKLKLTKGTIKDNIDKIIFEDAPFGKSFSSVVLVDTSIQEKVYVYLSGSDSIISEKDISYTSPDEMITKTSPEIDLRTYKQQAEGYRYAKTDSREEIVNAYLADAKAKKITITFSDNLISDIINTINDKQLSIFADEFADVSLLASKVQATERSLSHPYTQSQDDWTIDIEPITIQKTSRATYDTAAEHVGYVIEKYGEQVDGTVKTYDKIIIEDPLSTKIIDKNVRYGAVYKYRIRSIYKFTATAVVSGGSTSTTALVSYLVASTGAQAVISCVEVIPPPAPVDINFIQTQEGLHISWNFPVNSQQDIKRFQLFKRKNINESFSLVREFYFDDSLSPVISPEKIPGSLVSRSLIPTKSYIDNNFNSLDDTFIYALCSVDARALSSGYSSQYQVSFNKITGKLQIVRISPPNAPKTYPNVLLEGDFFPDIIKDSGHKRIRVFFDPEYSDVLNEKGKSINLINAKGLDKPSYRMNITELQLAQSKEIDIFVNNTKNSTIFGIPPSQGYLYTQS